MQPGLLIKKNSEKTPRKLIIRKTQRHQLHIFMKINRVRNCNMNYNDLAHAFLVNDSKSLSMKPVSESLIHK